ncbi:hypothetical protein CPB84DRAFT_1743667 [Gymnopilus junonius]|uniref:CBM1 domain-containing protein n=1 Tax=Gymnopilus junonius TaxID=109634 RepID=A0A9P5NWY6_GYMJU|nr:hypothetical protein CPB84DRAFT_1743667 [Gymnopilus junonius]
MARSTIFVALACAAFDRVSAQSGAWGQCGGQGWSGATTCVAGYTCTFSNPYYSQCLPGAASSVPTTTPGSGTTTVPTGTTTTTAPSSTATLQTGYSFIRAVEDPNFHQYLRSETINTPGPAVLGDPSLAAQFQITNGQLTGDVKLAVSWSTAPSPNGTFTWSGDTVEWSSPSVSRPQSNAWLVCPDAAGNKLLFVNLGPYDYNTPTGCADETIHAYTGATATA